MQIMVTEQRNENGRVNFEMICGKKAAYVGYHAELGTIDVLCKNASTKSGKEWDDVSGAVGAKRKLHTSRPKCGQ